MPFCPEEGVKTDFYRPFIYEIFGVKACNQHEIYEVYRRCFKMYLLFLLV